jgi:hypothetical protein
MPKRWLSHNRKRCIWPPSGLACRSGYTWASHVIWTACAFTPNRDCTIVPFPAAPACC